MSTELIGTGMSLLLVVFYHIGDRYPTQSRPPSYIVTGAVTVFKFETCR